jgi:hypothetical protein
VGFGRFGDSSRTGADIVSQLQNTYSAIKSAIDNGLSDNSSYTNLADAITVGNAELNSTRHDSSKEKVLVLISDGSPNQPNTSSTFHSGFFSPTSNAQDASRESWDNPAGAYGDEEGDASDPVSENDQHRYFNFNIPALPANATIRGIEAKVDAWATTTATVTIQNPASAQASPSGASGSWSNPQNAYTSNGQYATSASDNAQENYGNFGLAIPPGATITGIEVISEEKMTGLSGRNRTGSASVALSWNNGGSNTWSSSKSLSIGTTESTDTLGSDTDKWGSHAWVPADFANGKFFVRITNTSNSGTLSLDHVQVRVSYTIKSTAPAPAQCQLGVDLSWNGGGNWSDEKKQMLSDTEATYTLGSPADDWISGFFGGHSWSPNDFANGSNKLVARVRAVGPGSGNCDPSSVDHLDWLQLQVTYDAPTDPVSAALAAADAAKISNTNIFTIYFGSGNPTLLAELASGSTANAGHQNGSYSDPGGVGAADTGWAAPSSNATDTGGHNNGFESNPARAYADDDQPAQNSNNAGDRHRYFGYNLSIPPGAVVSGIEVRPNWWVDSTSGFNNNNSLGIELSYDAGAHWTSSKTDSNDSTSHSHATTLGGTSDLWGRSAWSASELSSANFRVRVTSNSNSSSRDFSLDYLPVRVTYTVNTENGDGDNFFVAPTSADMKGIFEFIGNQVCPAINNVAAANPPTQANLFVLTQVINNNSGTSAAPSFTDAVTASNATPGSFAGVDTPGKLVTLDPGSYSVVQSAAPSGYTTTYTDSCSSSASGSNIAAGESRVCVITNDDIPPPPPPPNLTITPGLWQEVPDTNP